MNHTICGTTKWILRNVSLLIFICSIIKSFSWFPDLRTSSSLFHFQDICLKKKRILKAMNEIVIVLQSHVFRGLLLPLTLTWIAVNSAGRSNFLWYYKCLIIFISLLSHKTWVLDILAYKYSSNNNTSPTFI